MWANTRDSYQKEGTMDTAVRDYQREHRDARFAVRISLSSAC
jgi:hypothetical protein